MIDKHTTQLVYIDAPIKDGESDKLNRVKYARRFVDHVLEHNSGNGLVVGLFGPGGSGKTSFINLTRKYFKEHSEDIIEINPSVFNGTNQTDQMLFSEISGASYGSMGREEEEAKEQPPSRSSGLVARLVEMTIVEIAIETAKEILVPYILDPSGATTVMFTPFALVRMIKKEAGQADKQRSTRKKKGEGEGEAADGLDKFRKSINEELAKIEKPLILVLDDIDGLRDFEIMGMLRSICKVAAFPNIVCIIACDKFRLERALSHDGVSGLDYIEKNIQTSFHLPEISQEILRNQIADIVKLNYSRDTDKFDRLEASGWNDALDFIILPLIRNMRDVYKFGSAISRAMVDLHDGVALIDVLVLRVVQLFLPDIHDIIVDNIDYLTVSYNSGQYNWAAPMPDNNNQRKKMCKELFEFRVAKLSMCLDQKIDDGHRQKYARQDIDKIIEAIVKYLFPTDFYSVLKNEAYFQETSWEVNQFVERRVAHKSIMHLYLTCTNNDDLRYADDAKKLLKNIHDQEFIRTYLDNLPSEWSEIVLRLRYYENEFASYVGGKGKVEFVVASLILLWNSLSRIGDYSKIVKSHALSHVKMITCMIINIIPEDIMGRGEFLFDALDSINALSAKVELIKLIRDYKHPTNMKVAKSVMNDIEEMLYLDILNDSDGGVMVGEWGISEIIFFAKKVARDRGESFNIPRSPILAFAVYERARHEGQGVNIHSSTMFDEDRAPHDGPTPDVPTKITDLLHETMIRLFKF